MRTLHMLYSSGSLEEQRARRRVASTVRSAERDAVLYAIDVDEAALDERPETPVIVTDEEQVFRGVPRDMERIEALLE